MTNIVDILKTVNGASFISIDTRTEPKIRKTLDTDDGRIPNPHFGRIEKLQTGSSVMVFQNKSINGYQSMVNRRLDKEGKDVEFKVGPRIWGKRIPNLPLVENHGKFYLEIIFLKAGEVVYLLDGQPIDKSEIRGMTDSPDGEQGGLDNKVKIRTVKMSSISTIRINQKSYSNFYCEI